jgi:hypothetical protein
VIKAQYMFDRLGWAIYIYRGSGRHHELQQPDGTWVEIKEGTQLQPTLVIEDAQELIKALQDAGVKAPNEYKLEGVMEAQKHHLDDMRRLVFEATFPLLDAKKFTASELQLTKGKDDVTTQL